MRELAWCLIVIGIASFFFAVYVDWNRQINDMIHGECAIVLFIFSIACLMIAGALTYIGEL